jgi:hypothetical protein
MKKVLTLEEFDQILEGQSQINEMNDDHDQAFITSVIYESFEVYDETDRDINDFFNQYVAEGAISNFIALAKNPITGIKLVNNAKKLARAQIMNATAKLDFEKKKEAAAKAKENNPEKADQAKRATELAQSAYDTKKEVAADQISAIEDRMTELSKDDPKLSKVSALLKTKARVEANKKLLKMLDAEERKQLQITIKDQEEKAREAEADMADYVKDERGKESSSDGGKDTDAKVQALQDKIEAVQNKMKSTDDPEQKSSLGLERAKLKQQIVKVKGDDPEGEKKAELKVNMEEARVKYRKEKTPENYLEFLNVALKYDESSEDNQEAIANRKQQIEDFKEKMKDAAQTAQSKGKTDKVEQEIEGLNKEKSSLEAKIADQKEGVKTSNELYTDALNKRDSIKDKESSEYEKAAEEYNRISSERHADQAKLAGMSAQLKELNGKISDLQNKKKK